jgi:hypothetical protein
MAALEWHCSNLVKVTQQTAHQVIGDAHSLRNGFEGLNHAELLDANLSIL